MVGQCKLCLRKGIVLKLSHYIPAAVYRTLRGAAAPGKNPDPVFVTQGRSFQSSRQERAHLLCSDCELRFSKSGEDWFFRNTLRKDGKFKLLETLLAGPASVYQPPVPLILYEADRFADIDADALTYFATSVFWRGSIYGWNNDGSMPVNLHGYADQFRRYLLGEREFPKNASLWAIVRPPGPVDKVTYSPVGISRSGRSYYRFPLPGFSFMLMMGPTLSEREKLYCLVRGAGRPLVVTALPDEHIFREARAALGLPTSAPHATIRNRRYQT